MKPTQDSNYIIEYVAIGHQVKVTAVDPVTGTEAVVIVPATLPQQAAAQQAINKLHYVLGKKS